MRRIGTWILVVILAFTISQKTEVNLIAASLYDIQGHWAYDDILALVDMDAIDGYPDGSFKPNDPISRAAFVKVLVKATGAETGYYDFFEDVFEHWAQYDVAAAVDAGYIRFSDYSTELDDFGNVSYAFQPEKNITREEIARIITRVIGETHLISEMSSTDFTDNGSIDELVRPYVGVASSMKIITGYKSGDFKPKATATRAEACVMINRALAYLENQTVKDVVDTEDIYEGMEHSVVKITGKITGYMESEAEQDLGSGVVVSKSGQVMTNFNTLEGAQSLQVEFSDGTIKQVTSVYNYDRHLDVIILNLEEGKYEPAPMGNSEKMNIGEQIYTLSYPLANNLSITDGLISSKNNDMMGHHYIEISAPTAPNSNGGALINKYGELVGITFGNNYYTGFKNLVLPLNHVYELLNTDNGLYSVAEVCSMDMEEDHLHKLMSGGSFFNILASEEKDCRDFDYDDEYHEADDKNLCLHFKTFHDMDMKNNSYDAMLIIEDGWGSIAYYESFPIRFSGNSVTGVHHYLDTSVNELGEGKYNCVLKIDGVTVESDNFVIQTSNSFEEYNCTSIKMKAYDHTNYNKYSETNDKEEQYTYYTRDTSSVGFVVNADFAEDYQFDDMTYTGKRLLFQMHIYSDSGVDYTFNSMGKVDYYTNNLDYFTFHTRDYIAGHYTAELSYNGVVVCKTEFEFVEGGGDSFEVNQEDIQLLQYGLTLDESLPVSNPKVYQPYMIEVTFLPSMNRAYRNYELEATIRTSGTNQYVTEPAVRKDSYIIEPDLFGEQTITLYNILAEEAYNEALQNGETLYLDLWMNGQLIKTWTFDNDIANYDYKIKDAFLFIADEEKLLNNEYIYEEIKALEKTEFSKSEDKGPVYCYLDIVTPEDVNEATVIKDLSFKINHGSSGSGKTWVYHVYESTMSSRVIKLSSIESLSKHTEAEHELELSTYDESGRRIPEILKTFYVTD